MAPEFKLPADNNAVFGQRVGGAEGKQAVVSNTNRTGETWVVTGNWLWSRMIWSYVGGSSRLNTLIISYTTRSIRHSNSLVTLESIESDISSGPVIRRLHTAPTWTFKQDATRQLAILKTVAAQDAGDWLNAHMHTCAHPRTHSQMRIPKRTRKRIQRYIFTRTYAFTRTHAQTHTHMHAHTHTHAYTRAHDNVHTCIDGHVLFIYLFVTFEHLLKQYKNKKQSIRIQCHGK